MGMTGKFGAPGIIIGAALMSLAAVAACSNSPAGCSKAADDQEMTAPLKPEERSREAARLFEEANLSLRDKRLDEAIELLEEGIEIEPSATAYNTLGMARKFKFIETGDAAWRDREIEAYKLGIEIDPGHLATILNLGTACFFLDRKDEALPLLRKVLQLLPNHPNRDHIEKMIAECRAS